MDAAEDAKYGAGKRGDELPEELNTAAKRLAVIGAAKQALEEEHRPQVAGSRKRTPSSWRQAAQ